MSMPIIRWSLTYMEYSYLHGGGWRSERAWPDGTWNSGNFALNGHVTKGMCRLFGSTRLWRDFWAAERRRFWAWLRHAFWAFETQEKNGISFSISPFFFCNILLRNPRFLRFYFQWFGPINGHYCRFGPLICHTRGQLISPYIIWMW